MQGCSMYCIGDKRPEAKEYQKFLTAYSLLWRPIGLNLGLKREVLNLIEAENRSQFRECLRQTLDRWLQLNPNATWSTLELAITNAKRVDNDLNPLDASEGVFYITSYIIVQASSYIQNLTNDYVASYNMQVVNIDNF